MHIQPYLYFNGCCEEAVGFYRKTMNAQVVTLSRFKDNPGTPTPEGAGEKILHAELKIDGTSIFASDGECSGSTDFKGFSLSLTADKDKVADRLFAAVASRCR